MTNYKTKYYSQRSSARGRNIEWHFTFESWFAWWGDDIVNRGRKQGQLVMARFGDTGPYHPDNVYKATTKENHNEAHLGKVAHNKGKLHSEQTKQKMKVSSPKRKLTEAEIINLRTINLGTKRSEETKQKMKDAWVRRKQNV
jgi:hypothetical protein